MLYISTAQIATAQAAIVAAQGTNLSLDVYELPYGAADDPDYAGNSFLGGYSLNSPKIVGSAVSYPVNNPYTNDTAWLTNNTLNATTGAMIAGKVYLVAGTVLATK